MHIYESGDEEKHVDYAARYSNYAGGLDFGLSAFVGTSREPSFLFGQPSEPPSPGDVSLIPYYEQIRQFGIDAQLTTETWLYKMEAIHRSGARNLQGQEEDLSRLPFWALNAVSMVSSVRPGI